MRWFGQIHRRDSEYIGQMMLNRDLPGRRKQEDLMVVVKVDMYLLQSLNLL